MMDDDLSLAGPPYKLPGVQSINLMSSLIWLCYIVIFDLALFLGKFVHGGWLGGTLLQIKALVDTSM